MKPRRGDPDHEAVSITVRASDGFERIRKIYRNAKHNGNRTLAKGDVEVRINRQTREKGADTGFRPEPGAELQNVNGRSVTIEAKRIERHGRHEGKDVATASGDVRIFGRLRRVRK